MRNEVGDFLEVLVMLDLALAKEGRNCTSLLELWVLAGRWKCRKSLMAQRAFRSPA